MSVSHLTVVLTQSYLLLEVLILLLAKRGDSIQLNPIVELPLGKIEGGTKESVSGRQFYSFEGVPYARPPVGRNRFKEPLPLEPWVNTWKANTIYKCLQYRHLSQPHVEDPVVGSEDCLYLNIYTPTLDPEANLDVIVFIHGGAFMFNYGAFQGPNILLDKNVVYINLNYRLGPFGFLSTEDNVVPGNNGLKDQIVAFKWIKKNVKYFGGNPSSVTITGNSAGGASVHFHYMINKSRGLFHRGFSQSGTALNPWVLMEEPLQKTKQIASLVGCPNKNSTEMIQCMKRRPGKQIVETIKSFQPWHYNPFSPFGVVADKWSDDPLIPEHPYLLLKKKLVDSVPWIASHTSSEGLYPAGEFYANGNSLEEIDKRWSEIIPHLLHYNETVDCNELDAVSNRIRKYYFGNKTVSRDTYASLVQMIGDRLFVVDIRKSVRLHADATSAPTYLYYFTYRGANSRSNLRSKSNKNFGAAHGDDASYILSMHLDTLSNEKDRLMSNIMVEIWLSVAKSGKPHIPKIEWTPVSNDSNTIHYLKIVSPENLLIEHKENLGHDEFWNLLPFKENEKLFEDNVKEKL